MCLLVSTLSATSVEAGVFVHTSRTESPSSPPSPPPPNINKTPAITTPLEPKEWLAFKTGRVFISLPFPLRKVLPKQLS